MNKNIKRKEYTKKEYLPEKLINKFHEDILSNNYEYRTKNNYLKCISIIYYHQVTDGIGLYDYVPLGSTYWKKVFGGNYYQKVIVPLLETQIIECFDFGYRTFPDVTKSKIIGKSNGTVGIRYRINPELLDDKFCSISYIEKGKVITAVEEIHSDKMQFTTSGIPDLNFHISIDPDKANTWVEINAESIVNNYIKHDFINDLPNDLKIQYKEYLDNGSYNTKYSNIQAAIFIATSKSKELFYYKDRFYVADVGSFIRQRVPALIHHYKQQISLIGSMPVEEVRNTLTLRIYSHLTNFPSNILQFININNNTVVQLDLRTSQFLLFANLLNIYITKGEQHLLSLFKHKRTITYITRLVKILDAHTNQLPKAGVN